MIVSNVTDLDLYKMRAVRLHRCKLDQPILVVPSRSTKVVNHSYKSKAKQIAPLNASKSEKLSVRRPTSLKKRRDHHAMI